MGKPACGPPLVKATSSQRQTQKPLLILYRQPLASSLHSSSVGLSLSSLLSFQVYSQSTADQGPSLSSDKMLKHQSPAKLLKPLTSLSLCLFPFHVESPPLFIKSNQGVYYEITFKFNLLRLL